MLVKPGILVDEVTAFLCIPVGCDRLKQVTHFQLIGIILGLRLHAAFFDHPQLQRRSPGRDTKNGCHITSTYGIGDITLRPVHSALKPAVVAHPCGITEHDRCCHYQLTAFARSKSLHFRDRARAMFSSTTSILASGVWWTFIR